MTVQQTRQSVAEAILGEIQWEDATTGFCRCPGIDLHSTANGEKDCKVYLDGAPTVFCIHSSCNAAIEETNRRLRSEIGKAERTGDNPAPYVPTEAERERHEQARQERKLAERAALHRESLLKRFAITPRDLWDQSPCKMPADEIPDSELWRLPLSLFEPDDLVWIGDKLDTGKPKHQAHFRAANEWLSGTDHPGPRICPSTFKAGSYSRSNEHVMHRRFIVIESDVLSWRDQCALLNLVRQTTRLRMVIHTGGKSLHGWFDTPPPDELRKLEVTLTKLGVDPACFRPAQPFRMPMVAHDKTGRLSGLGYYDGGAR